MAMASWWPRAWTASRPPSPGTQCCAWHYPQHDALGSVRQWTDAAAAVLAMQAYSPFGVPRTALGPAPWGFTGEWHDPGGLVYLRARWYNPAWGRFTQVDPLSGFLGAPATQHPYAYVLNNPVSLTDPSGRGIFLVLLLSGAGGALFHGIGYMLANPGCSLSEYLDLPEFQRALLVGLISGAVGGAVSWGVSSLMSWGLGRLVINGVLRGTMPVWGRLAIVAAVGAASGALGAGAAQVSANLLLDRPWREGVGRAMLWGGVAGGAIAGLAYGFSYLAQRGIPATQPPTSHRALRRAMIKEGKLPPAGMVDPEVHHELPWREALRYWFAGPGRGLNVNEVQFGRWIADVRHDAVTAPYQRAWESFMGLVPDAVRFEVLWFLNILRSSPGFP